MVTNSQIRSNNRVDVNFKGSNLFSEVDSDELINELVLNGILYKKRIYITSKNVTFFIQNG